MKRIKNREYLLDYYLVGNDKNYFYMDYVDKSLKDVVYGKSLKML